ncbi:MAG: hypothetical protein Tsb002_14020 [Wenzhouxiangellaceae bacterium]
MFNKPWQIQSNNGSVRFWYDSEHSRFKREDVGERIEYYIGNVEVLKEDGETTYRRSVAGALIRFEPRSGDTSTQDINNSHRAYAITDHLGSTVALYKFNCTDLCQISKQRRLLIW